MTTKTTSQRPTKNILSVNAEQNPKNGHATKDGYKKSNHNTSTEEYITIYLKYAH
jgi:hypothetical protein